jgi:hypothetical protein
MPLPYVISANIKREDAIALINRLADDEEFREQFEQNTQQILHENKIEVTPQSLPEEVRLPPPDAIRDFLTLVEERIVPESASPFALALLILAFAAMPLVIGDRPSRDGAG